MLMSRPKIYFSMQTVFFFVFIRVHFHSHRMRLRALKQMQVHKVARLASVLMYVPVSVSVCAVCMCFQVI